MTHTRFWAVAALLTVASVAACKAAPAAGVNQAASPAEAAQAAVPPPTAAANPVTFSGVVTETMNSGGYTYLKLHGGKDGKEDVWAACAEFAVKVGERVSVPLEMPMENFHSKSLNRDFPVIYFVSAATREGETPAGAGRAPAVAGDPMGMVGSHQAPAATVTPVEPIPPAPGGLKIADVWAQRKALAGKPLIVRGKVVKVNNAIMDRNWVHVQDGSGSAKDGTHDLTITTDAVVKPGDIVTVSGVLASEKDFGSGYAYDAILEKAKVTGK